MGLKSVRKHESGAGVLKTKEEILQEFQNRMNYVRMAQTSYAKSEFIDAIESYNNYLSVVAKVNNCGPYELTPVMFTNNATNKTELMMVSHIYWNLTKIYDSSSIMGDNFRKALNQFVRFTIGSPYRAVNTKMIRKYMRSKKSHNVREFEVAYREIVKNSKKCYVATACYGEDHPITAELRSIRNRLLENAVGEYFVWHYYQVSPHLVRFCQQSGIVGKLLTLFALRPLVFLVYKILR